MGMAQPDVWVSATMPSIVGWSRSNPRFSTSAAMNRDTLAEQLTVVTSPIMLRVPTLPLRRRIPLERTVGHGTRRRGPRLRQLVALLDRPVFEVMDVDMVAGRDGHGGIPDDLAVLAHRSRSGDRA